MWSVLLLVHLAVYVGHIRAAPFVYEDRSAVALGEDMIWTSRPVTRLSWVLTRTPAEAHAVSWALHAGVASAVWGLGVALGVGLWGGLVAGALVLWHPLTVETAAYAAARSESLAALGVVLACLAGLYGRWGWAVVAGLLAVGAKETAVVGLVLVPLVCWGTRRPWRVPVVVGGGGLFVVAVGAWATGMFEIGLSPGVSAQHGEWALAQAAAAYRLIGLTVWPVGLTVDADIDLYGMAARWGAVAGLLGLAGLAWRLRDRGRLVAMGLAWMLVCVVPRLVVLTPRSYLNEHQWYLPLIGLVLAGTALLVPREA